MTECTRSSTHADPKEQIRLMKHNVEERLREIRTKMMSHAKYSCTQMSSANFQRTGNTDTVRCATCNLEVSDWTDEMVPFTVHARLSPQCSFVRSRLSMNSSESDDRDNPPKRQKTHLTSNQCRHHVKLVEVKSIKQIRRRTFSHWSRRTKPSSEQMIAAGFFSCNVGDRVICIYCNLICQQWVREVDDPSEVHKTFSPRCQFVLSMLIHPDLSPTMILNDISTSNGNNPTLQLNNTDEHRFGQIVYTKPCHSIYSDINKRLQSFASWSSESAPPVDELVRAGFFHAGTGNDVVTCFYCNGSLQNWAATDKPMHEHARWFGHCPYAKQLCGDELHRRIQEANRAQQERAKANQFDERNENNHSSLSNGHQLQLTDPNTLSRLVAARLDLSISQRLLDQNFKLSVIKRCWEDQLQLKSNPIEPHGKYFSFIHSEDDFATDSDLFVCCVILQKQIDHIQGNKENIIIPSVRMRLIREVGQADLTSSNSTDQEEGRTQSFPSTSTLQSTTTEVKKEQPHVSETNPAKNTSVSNPCIICYEDEKRLACIPCGHFTACVPCSHSLRTCPVCRRGIDAFVRIYI